MQANKGALFRETSIVKHEGWKLKRLEWDSHQRTPNELRGAMQLKTEREAFKREKKLKSKNPDFCRNAFIAFHHHKWVLVFSRKIECNLIVAQPCGQQLKL